MISQVLGRPYVRQELVRGSGESIQDRFPKHPTKPVYGGIYMAFR